MKVYDEGSVTAPPVAECACARAVRAHGAATGGVGEYSSAQAAAACTGDGTYGTHEEWYGYGNGVGSWGEYTSRVRGGRPRCWLQSLPDTEAGAPVHICCTAACQLH